MGGFYEERRSVWANVVNGRLRRKEGDEVKDSDGFVGVIVGVRLKRSQYQNQPPVGVLELVMVNPDDGSSTEVIISGTVLLADGSPTTYGRMLVTRLVKPGNVAKGEVIDISVWTPEEGSKVTCATVRPAGVKETMKPIDHDKSDPKLGEKIVAWIDELTATHGSYGRSSSSEPTPAAVPAASSNNEPPMPKGDGRPFPEQDDLPF